MAAMRNRRCICCVLLGVGTWFWSSTPGGSPLDFAELSSQPGRRRVALVTGANKGIGKEVARKLASAGVSVVLGCRNEGLGKAAAGELQSDGCEVSFTRLDLREPDTILSARDFIAEKCGGLDILVNNAALCYNDPTLYGKCEFTPFERQAGATVSTNFFGTLGATRAMLPLLRSSASPRIVNVVSYAGRLAILRSREQVARFTSPDLKVGQLETMMREFVHDVESGVHASKGWPNTCYGMSKLGLIALTRVLARDEPEIMVNSVDPGYCATDQNMHQGIQSAEHGARTPAFLALLPDTSFASGKYFRDGAEVAW